MENQGMAAGMKRPAINDVLIIATEQVTTPDRR